MQPMDFDKPSAREKSGGLSGIIMRFGTGFLIEILAHSQCQH